MSGEAGGGAPDRYYALRGWILAGLMGVLAVSRFLSDAPLWPAGLILVAAGAAYRLHAGRYMPGHSNGRHLEAGPLITAGPYAFGRHPLYLSNLVSIAGLIVFAHCLPIWGEAALFAAAWLHHLRLAHAEERHLAAAHGAAYRSYMDVTSRWMGFPRRPAAGLVGAPDRSGSGGWAGALSRQGANVAKAAVSALLLWGLAAVRV